MALETQYVIGKSAQGDFPTICRVIKVNGAEVSRGEPDFAEVKAAYPAIIEEYFTAVAEWARNYADYIDTQSDFSAGSYIETQKASRFTYDFMNKFDYLSVADQMPHLQAPAVVEETPVTE